MRAVVALGGNAIAESAEDTFETQQATVEETVGGLARLLPEYDLVLTHGNGPQVGNRLRQQERADAPTMPLDVLVAETQAQIGALLQRALDATLEEHFLTVVTQTVVDPEAPAFENPEKPIGPVYSPEEAADADFETAKVGEGARPYRRVVPSPEPERVVEADEIAAMVDRGRGVVCGGGGGVPVAETDQGLRGVAAVVDKDHTSARLARAVEAEELLFVTDVDHVYRDYGGPDETALTTPDRETLRELHESGAFPPGSMGPKIRACHDFLDAGGERAIVTDADNLVDAVAGDVGTRIR